jgi:hypothetical protein
MKLIIEKCGEEFGEENCGEERAALLARSWHLPSPGRALHNLELKAPNRLGLVLVASLKSSLYRTGS